MCLASGTLEDQKRGAVAVPIPAAWFGLVHFLSFDGLAAGSSCLVEMDDLEAVCELFDLWENVWKGGWKS